MDDKKISAKYGEGDHGSRNPYQRRPERASWTEVEVYERPDGTRYKLTREVSRWGGSFACGDWSAPIEIGG